MKNLGSSQTLIFFNCDFLNSIFQVKKCKGYFKTIPRNYNETFSFAMFVNKSLEKVLRNLNCIKN